VPGSGHLPLTEQELAGLGVHRLPLPIPFVAAGGPVNAYVIEADGGGLILFDAGLGSDQAEAALQAGFDRLGFRFEEVRYIVVSHGHVDHYGAARWVQERWKKVRQGGELPVFAHARDLPKIDELGPRLRDQHHLYGAHFFRLGVPMEAMEAMVASGEGSTRLARRVPDVRPIEEGAIVEGRGLRFEVIEMPGHTPGLICLWAPELGVLLPADHLLEKVSPNPIIELDAEGRQVHRPLATYLKSIDRTRMLEISLVMPGHGPGFSGHRALIDGLLGFYEKRQARLLGLLAERPRTGWELCRAIFPRAGTGDAFLTMSETVANLEVLEDRGAVVRVEAQGAWLFQRTA
jgi:glyoxylase-like metal-dependent hydrolase (beta-lactamase superfamily II)